MISPRALSLLCCLICICLPQIPTANAYANWLKCYVDLDDTEVVMNQKILAHHNADHVVELQIQRVDHHDNDLKPNPNDWQSASSDEKVHFPADKTTIWKVKVKPPAAVQTTNMQFVIETESMFRDGSGTSEDGAEFTYPKMCKGRRSFARNYNEAVTLEINGSADSVELWAAWAIGFGQVSLTPRLVLLKGDQEDETQQEEEL